MLLNRNGRATGATLRVPVLAIVATMMAAGCAAGADPGESDTAEQAAGTTANSPESNEAGDAIELRMAWWGGADRHERTIAALDLYMERNSHVTITHEYTGDLPSHDERLSTQIAGQNAPDIIQMSPQIIIEYATRGALLDLNPYIGNGLDLEHWDEAIVEEAVVDGNLVGLAGGADANAVVVNATKLDELGLELPADQWTWQDFADLASEITEQAGEGYWGSADAGGKFETLQVFLRQRGKDLFKDGQIDFDEIDIADMWNYWDGLRRNGAIVPPDVQASVTRSIDTSTLIQNQAAIDFTTGSQFQNFAGLTADDLVLRMYPFGEDGTPGQVLRSPLYFSAYSGTPNPEAAVDVINFLLNDADAVKILGTSRGVPTSFSMRDVLQATLSDDIEEAPFHYLSLVTEFGTPVEPALPGFADFRDLYERSYQEVAFGQVGVEEGARNFVQQAAALFE